MLRRLRASTVLEMARKRVGKRVKKDIKKQTSVLNSDEEDSFYNVNHVARKDDDEVDEFYNKKDKVLLARREANSDSEPEHVYAMSSDDDDDDSDEENELLNEDHANDMVARFVKKKEIDSDIEEQEEDVPDGKAWGRKRQDFYDNDYDVKDTAGAVMSEQDRQIAKMEEEEALAIQKRLANEVDEDVFGLDDLQPAPEDQESSGKIEMLDIRKLPRKKLLRMVEEESPELRGLIDDCRDKLRELNQELTPIAELFRAGQLPRGTTAEDYVMLRHNLLLSYTTNVCFYLSLKAKRVNIKNHPIIKRLGQFKRFITELDKTRERILPQIQVVLQKIERGEPFKVFGAENSEDDEKESSDGDDENDFDAQLSDEEIADDLTPTTKATKRTLDSAEQEILALYDGIKTSKKLKTDEASEEEYEEPIDDPAAMFGDTDSENDEPVFLEGKAGDEDEDSESDDLLKEKSPGTTQKDPGDQEEAFDDDGRRAINYQIAKNKGLTPKRKKEYRNPRVRHRIKYRKANIRRKGQVRAMRNESGHYGGETSGINKQVVKSVKLK